LSRVDYLLQHRAFRITLVHNRHTSTCAECCSSSSLWHTQVQSRSIPSTAWRTALAQCSWASAVQVSCDS